MVPSANTRHFRIKAAQRDLIAAAGGQVRAAEICSYGKSTVGRWADIDSPEWMPLDAVDKLEAETGLKVWTKAWVETRGLKLVSEDGEASDGASLAGEMAELLASFSALLSEWSLTSADGHASPNEAERMRRLVPEMEDRLARLKDALARVKAEGGMSVIHGGKGG